MREISRILSVPTSTVQHWVKTYVLIYESPAPKGAVAITTELDEIHSFVESDEYDKPIAIFPVCRFGYGRSNEI
jgi:hypothetical protein